MELKQFETDRSRIILPTAKELQYCGRIDTTVDTEPIFIYPCSSITTNFTGTSIKIILSNNHSYWDNYIGYIIDGKQEKMRIPEDTNVVCLTLANNLEDSLHNLTIFKRMDGCHYFTFYGLVIDKGADIFMPSPEKQRRIEVYGDSVSAGEVSEALDYVGKPDPEHHGEYSNSWYSYAFITARKLNAQIHDIAQGGISLLDGTGWFAAPHYYGIENTWDKLKYHLELGERTPWDFSKYTPHVVIVAIGQNDNHPEDYMKEDYHGDKADYWRSHYRKWIQKIRGKYPKALIILSTTILEHDANWDNAIDEVCNDLNDSRIVHFLYEQNGCGTPGHIRIPEAEKMAEELSEFIESFGDSIWE
jgi:hypothetical protein